MTEFVGGAVVVSKINLGNEKNAARNNFLVCKLLESVVFAFFFLTACDDVQ